MKAQFLPQGWSALSAVTVGALAAIGAKLGAALWSVGPGLLAGLLAAVPKG